MRLSDKVLVQQIDDEHVVIIDESAGQEIVISEKIALQLLPAMQYFFPAAFIDITPWISAEPVVAEEPAT